MPLGSSVYTPFGIIRHGSGISAILLWLHNNIMTRHSCINIALLCRWNIEAMKTAPKQRYPVAVFGYVSTQYTYFVVCIILWTSIIGELALSHMFAREERTYVRGTFLRVVCLLLLRHNSAYMAVFYVEYYYL